ALLDEDIGRDVCGHVPNGLRVGVFQMRESSNDARVGPQHFFQRLPVAAQAERFASADAAARVPIEQLYFPACPRWPIVQCLAFDTGCSAAADPHFIGVAALRRIWVANLRDVLQSGDMDSQSGGRMQHLRVIEPVKRQTRTPRRSKTVRKEPSDEG